MTYLTFDSGFDKLVSLPETGLGYQIIDATNIITHRRKRYIVYNCQLYIELPSGNADIKANLINDGFELALSKSVPTYLDVSSFHIVSRKEISASQFLSEEKRNLKHRYSGKKSALESDTEKANGTEVFARLSPYLDDNRIDPIDMKLLKGSFTTTGEDYGTCIHYNDDPVDRYALPSNKSIEWAYIIQPLNCDNLKRGIVQPAFDKMGGGIEAFFEAGTSKGTYLMRRKYYEAP